MSTLTKTWLFCCAFSMAIQSSGLVTLSASPRAQQSKPSSCSAYTIEDLLTLIKGRVAEKRLIENINECGISFQVTGNIEAQLAAAGATTSVIKLARDKAPKLPVTPPQQPPVPSGLDPAVA